MVELHPKWKEMIGNLTHKEWVEILKTCYVQQPLNNNNCGNHKHVINLRQQLKGLVIGPLDKNGGAIMGMLPLHLS